MDRLTLRIGPQAGRPFAAGETPGSGWDDGNLFNFG
jgi:hypothetical protein